MLHCHPVSRYCKLMYFIVFQNCFLLVVFTLKNHLFRILKRSFDPISHCSKLVPKLWTPRQLGPSVLLFLFCMPVIGSSKAMIVLPGYQGLTSVWSISCSQSTLYKGPASIDFKKSKFFEPEFRVECRVAHGLICWTNDHTLSDAILQRRVHANIDWESKSVSQGVKCMVKECKAPTKLSTVLLDEL